MAEIAEKVVSRNLLYSGLSSELRKEYIIYDVDGQGGAVQAEEEAMALLTTTAGATWIDTVAGVTLYLTDRILDPQPAEQPNGTFVFKGVAIYRTGKRSNQPYCAQEFDTTGGTKHVRQAIRTISGSVRNAPGAMARWHSGAVNVSPDGIEGVDVVAPEFVHTKNCKVAPGTVTSSLIRMLMEYTGTVDSNANFPDESQFHAGECLFLGARGSFQEENWDLQLSWKISLNEETLIINEGTANPIEINAPSDPDGNGPADLRPDVPLPYQNWDKLGWEYLWISYESDDDGQGLPVKVATYAYVEQVYPYKDHNDFLQLLPPNA